MTTRMSSSCRFVTRRLFNREAPVLSELNFRNNSIGFLRFFFAAMVIWSHSYPLGGFGDDPISVFSHGAENGGSIAVAAFFLLSGLLITRSYLSSANLWRFLWHRALRIFPAFWACLIVVALGFAPIVYFHEHGSLAGFGAAHDSPWRYMVVNASLWMRQYGIAGSLENMPFPLSFNGSLWTLRFEFLCYLAVGLFGVTGLLKRSPIAVLCATGLLYVVYGIPIAFKGLLPGPIAFNAITQGNNRFVPELLVYFFFGACALLYAKHIPMRALIAWICALLSVVALLSPIYALVVPPSLSYVILYIAKNWPPKSFDRYGDVSYGLYIYAFPTQQVLATYGVNALGLAPYVLLATAISIVLAASSWFMIEKPSLSLKDARPFFRKASLGE